MISGGANGIVVDGAAATSNTILGNYIGADATGNTVIGNNFDGVRIENGASLNTVGGGTVSHGNVIAGAGDDAIQINGESSDNNTIQHNLLGVSADGTTLLGNQRDGIQIQGGADNTNILDNLVAGSAWSGVAVEGASDGTVIRGNIVGTDVTKTNNWGSGHFGIIVDGGATLTSIGGVSSGHGNVVAFSGQAATSANDGVAVVNATSTEIWGNSIFANVGQGIDLWDGGDDGATPNDAGDLDTGPQQSAKLGGADVDCDQ